MSLKRKASCELTRRSIADLAQRQTSQQQLPPQHISNMGDTFQNIWNWCERAWSGVFGGRQTIAATASDVQRHRAASTAGRATSEKRHKSHSGERRTSEQTSRSKTARSRSTKVPYKVPGLGLLDHTGCETQEDFAKRDDAFFEPPELYSIGTTSKSGQLHTPPLDHAAGRDDHKSEYRAPFEDEDEEPQQIYSPPTPDSLSPPLSTTNTTSVGLRAAPAPQILSRKENRDPTKRTSRLIEKPEDVLLSDDVPELRPSEFMLRQREKIRKEQEKKDREEALRKKKERRLTRRVPDQYLIQDLSLKWTKIVDSAMHNHSTIATAKSGTPLTLKDFGTLLQRTRWLNDEIVNSYIEWVVDAANKAADADAKAAGETNTVPKFMAHNSFFHPNLVNKGPASTERLMKRMKVPGKSLLEVDTMFVPICKNSHWTIGVVRPIARTIELFDSFGGSPHHFNKLMREWLKHQLESAYKEEEWKEPRTVYAEQTNGYDCGVFTCTNAFCVAFGLDTRCYKESDLGQQRKNIAAILINGGFKGEFEWSFGI